MKKESNDVLSWPLIEQKSSGIKEEVKKQLWLAGPLIAVSLLQFCLQVISVMFVGHLGSLPLSAAAVATSFASVTGFTFLEKKTKIALNQVFVPKLALKVKSHKNSI
ncbi:hypothetical protein DY000_02029570 [Brassica cretica]|uniref:Uncharacterized protein n=1 Tax=Brassica cretica TaxID=69181 RepID=A0ABQ7DKD3_BRACR|nr:hypothetical protein DY000_02029570 [Brassica cretica]